MSIDAAARGNELGHRQGGQVAQERLRQWSEELAAREALLQQYLKWAREARVPPLSRREANRRGIGHLYRRRDPFWLVASAVGRTMATTSLAGVYQSGNTVIHGFKAHVLAERIAQRVAAVGHPWPEQS